MKTPIRMLAPLFVLAPLALVACKSDADKAIDYMEQQADIVDKDKDDCAKMGKDLKEWDSSTKDDRKKLKDKMKDQKPSEEEQKKLAEKYKDRLAKVEEKMKGMQKCMTNSDVMDMYMHKD